MTKVITVQNLSTKYGQKVVLENLSFTIQAGEIVGLLGANGAGKTTLIKVLLGMQEINSGQVQILQQNPHSQSIKEQIGVMFQDDLVIKRVRAVELIELARSLYSKPLASKNLEQIADLGKDGKNYVNKLSGGQQRKLNFALALAGDPTLLFLDEPTAGMDTTSRHHFWHYVRQLAAQGKTIIVTSHYLAEIEDIATRILFLKNHKLIHDGSLADLRANFSYKSVTFKSNLTPQQLALNSGNLQSYEHNHYLFVVQDIDQFLQELVSQMSQIHDLQIKETSLDDIFQQLEEK
ncbi:ABC transporter ATP-binding protein [Bombilactobacillus bombi]|uniref:ABC transporter ATP-binding protein n=1 Tax=Bombilactobacillus bombi TaxID=1303590 RepID=UPI0015E61AA8|nr:ABC transporter ATP-binding protein [Bombilactobacillus bombi]MBA1434910.1 ABC transporter ATP-binding protein [Bombilactobacillus bombi]